jgi:hypothetical protein
MWGVVGDNERGSELRECEESNDGEHIVKHEQLSKQVINEGREGGTNTGRLMKYVDNFSEISGFHGGDSEDGCRLGCTVV